MRFLILLGIILIFTTVAIPQNFKVTNDKWWGNDKLAHGCGSYALTDVINTFTPLNHWQSGIVTSALGILWEVQADAIKYNGVWEEIMDSSDEFSSKDLAWNTLGVLTYCCKEELKNKNIQIQIGNKKIEFGLTLHF